MSRTLSNFLYGMGSILNLYPVDYVMPRSARGRRTDEEALRGDWQKIGGDFQTAAEKVVGAHGTSEQTEPRDAAHGGSR